MAIIKRNIIYQPEKKIATDIYFPNDTNSDTKILIFWHGGGWFRGSKDDLKAIGVSLANAGFLTFIPDYSLATQYHFPAAHEDALRFCNWLLKSEYTDEDDQKNIFQIGASVGGTLALYTAGKYGFPTVTWSAPVDFSNWIKNHPDIKASIDAQKELGLNSPAQIHDSFYKYFTLAYAGENDEALLKKMDAQSYNFSNLKQLMMINSAHELTPLDSVLNFIKHLANENKQVQLLVIKGDRHAMSYSQEYLDESIDFLYQTIKRQK